MPPLAKVIGLASTVLLLATLVGLLVRGHWRAWYSFAAYTLILSVFSSLYFISAELFYSPRVWMLQENVLNAVRFGMALELAARTFRGYPGARSTLNFVVTLVVGATLALVLPSASQGADYASFISVMQPRLISGSVWLFTAIAALILWYRLPVLAFRKTILLSYLPYLIFSTVFLDLLRQHDWPPILGYLNQVVYLALVSFWVYTAWKVTVTGDPDPPSAPSAPGVRLKRSRTVLPSLS
jgi:hypothetical protein